VVAACSTGGAVGRRRLVPPHCAVAPEALHASHPALQRRTRAIRSAQKSAHSSAVGVTKSFDTSGYEPLTYLRCLWILAG